MDLARQWLEKGNCLNKLEPPNLANLGSAGTLVDQAIDHIENIQHVHPAQQNGDLISIAVDDIKVLTGLMKVVVVFGIYPNLPDSSMIDVQGRIPLWPLPAKNQGESASSALERCINKLAAIVEKNDDVAKLILISPFMIDLLAGFAENPKAYYELASKLPTFSLYKLLLNLQSCARPPALTRRSLQTIIIDRKDAVRTLLELVIESEEEPDSINRTSIDRAVMVFQSVPAQVSTKQYIDHLGDQFYKLLATRSSVSSSKLTQACALSALQLNSMQPKLLGRLRNLLVGPFTLAKTTLSEGCSFSNSAGAISSCIETSSQASPSSFIQHVISSVIVSLWLLICSSNADHDESNPLLVLGCKCIEYYPEIILKLVTNLLVTKLPGNLCWSIISGKEPNLYETVVSGGQGPDEIKSLLQLIDTRMRSLASLVLQLGDATATRILICLIESYASESFSDDPTSSLSKLLVAKGIETLSTDDDIKKKLFDDPTQMIDFSFTIINARCSEARRKRPHERNSLSALQRVPDLEQLDLGDSDDDDDLEGQEATDGDVSGSNSAETNEENTLLEITLNLLGSALMEALSNDKTSLALTEERKTSLEMLTKLESVPKTIRARADFCYELITGSNRVAKEVDMESNEEILTTAMQALREPLVPSRAYGIHLISILISRNAIPLKTAFDFYAEELGDEDSYIYLNAIKAIEDSTKFVKTENVIELLIPHTKNSSSSNIDRALRAREALIRILTPGSVHKVSSALIYSFLEDLRAPARENQDVRIRLSSASAIGIIVSQFPMSVPSELQSDISDCTLGILRHEKGEEESSQALRRSIVVLALEIVNGINDGSLSSISSQRLDSIVLELNQVIQETDDDTLKDHCKAVLDSCKLAL